VRFSSCDVSCLSSTGWLSYCHWSIELSKFNCRAGDYKAALFAGGVLVGIIVGVCGTHFFLHHHIRDRWFAHRTEGASGMLRPRMTMSEVEQLFGKPDRIDVVDGRIEDKYEHPKEIIWTYSRYKITESGETYGKPTSDLYR
jgi:hypothetical protein